MIKQISLKADKIKLCHRFTSPAFQCLFAREVTAAFPKGVLLWHQVHLSIKCRVAVEVYFPGIEFGITLHRLHGTTGQAKHPSEFHLMGSEIRASP